MRTDSIHIEDIERILWEIQEELTTARRALKERGLQTKHDLYLFGEATIEDAFERLLGKSMIRQSTTTPENP